MHLGLRIIQNFMASRDVLVITRDGVRRYSIAWMEKWVELMNSSTGWVCIGDPIICNTQQIDHHEAQQNCGIQSAY